MFMSRVVCCKQELSYFDDQRNSTGALCVRLSTDASAVQGVSMLLLYLQPEAVLYDYHYTVDQNTVIANKWIPTITINW